MEVNHLIMDAIVQIHIPFYNDKGVKVMVKQSQNLFPQDATQVSLTIKVQDKQKKRPPIS